MKKKLEPKIDRRRVQQSVTQFPTVWELIDEIVKTGEFRSRSDYLESLVIPDLQNRGVDLRGVPSPWKSDWKNR